MTNDDDANFEIIINILRDDMIIESISVDREPTDSDDPIIRMLIKFRDENRD